MKKLTLTVSTVVAAALVTTSAFAIDRKMQLKRSGDEAIKAAVTIPMAVADKSVAVGNATVDLFENGTELQVPSAEAAVKMTGNKIANGIDHTGTLIGGTAVGMAKNGKEALLGGAGMLGGIAELNGQKIADGATSLVTGIAGAAYQPVDSTLRFVGKVPVIGFLFNAIADAGDHAGNSAKNMVGVVHGSNNELTADTTTGFQDLDAKGTKLTQALGIRGAQPTSVAGTGTRH